jgi:tRNA threonylcarbamoyladenosine biosynthesis protein TsaE
MDYPYTQFITSEEETAALARNFAKQLEGGEVVSLTGRLGSGKTFFVRHAAKYFGIENVTSPTFAIINVYNGKKVINHFDFYRINKAEELYEIGINDYFNDSESITFIEWAELFPEVLPAKRINITIKLNDDFTREITINTLG